MCHEHVCIMCSGCHGGSETVAGGWNGAEKGVLGREGGIGG